MSAPSGFCAFQERGKGHGGFEKGKTMQAASGKGDGAFQKGLSDGSKGLGKGKAELWALKGKGKTASSEFKGHEKGFLSQKGSPCQKGSEAKGMPSAQKGTEKGKHGDGWCKMGQKGAKGSEKGPFFKGEKGKGIASGNLAKPEDASDSAGKGPHGQALELPGSTAPGGDSVKVPVVEKPADGLHSPETRAAHVDEEPAAGSNSSAAADAKPAEASSPHENRAETVGQKDADPGSSTPSVAQSAEALGPPEKGDGAPDAVDPSGSAKGAAAATLEAALPAPQEEPTEVVQPAEAFVAETPAFANLFSEPPRNEAVVPFVPRRQLFGLPAPTEEEGKDPFFPEFVQPKGDAEILNVLRYIVDNKNSNHQWLDPVLRACERHSQFETYCDFLLTEILPDAEAQEWEFGASGWADVWDLHWFLENKDARNTWWTRHALALLRQQKQQLVKEEPESPTESGWGCHFFDVKVASLRCSAEWQAGYLLAMFDEALICG